jgi:hypothetical protein
MKAQTHYVYEWYRMDLNLPYYIGKGTDNRAHSLVRNKHANDTTRYLLANGIRREIRIIATFDNKKSAFEFEQERIEFWWYLKDHGILTNQTLGGDSGPVLCGNDNGFFGRKHSEESKAKMSAALKGRKPPITGKRHTEESKAKMSASHKGKTGNKTMLGRKHSEETKAKMRAAKLGKKPNNYGKKVDPEKLAKFSDRMKSVWADRRGTNNGN